MFIPTTFYWRKEPAGWTNLVYLDGGAEVVIEHKLLNKKISQITTEDLAVAIGTQTHIPANKLPDLGKLLADLKNKVYGRVVTIEECPYQRFVVFHACMESDPGEEINDNYVNNYVIARTYDEAVEKAEKAGWIHDMAYYDVWPIEKLIAHLQEAAALPESEFLKDFNDSVNNHADDEDEDLCPDCLEPSDTCECGEY